MNEDVLQATGRAFKRFRALARRRFNREDYQGAIDACHAWNEYMLAHPEAPYPDAWADMTRIEQDAELKLRHRGTLLTF